MKTGSTIFLRAVILLLGIGILAALLWEPHLEGRNVHATLFEIYFKDPFLAYVYLGSVPFFVALYQAFKVMGYVARNETFSEATVKSLRMIKYCAIATATFILGADAYLILAAREKEDPAGAVMIGIVAMLASIIIGTAAAVFEKVLQHAVALKTENDLTV